MHVCSFRYVSVLVELTRMEGTRHGRLIASQMLDVAIRVQAIRPFTVTQMVRNSSCMLRARIILLKLSSPHRQPGFLDNILAIPLDIEGQL